MMLNILQGTGHPSTARSYPTQNVTSAKVEKSYAKTKSVLESHATGMDLRG